MLILSVLNKQLVYWDRWRTTWIFEWPQWCIMYWLIFPIFEYCNIIVGKGKVDYKDYRIRVEDVYLKWNSYTHGSHFLNILKWLSVEEIVKLSTAIIKYKCENKECLKYLYTIKYSGSRKSCNTRCSLA